MLRLPLGPGGPVPNGPATGTPPDAASAVGVPADLPVALCLRDPLRREVRAWVEGELGWQVVPESGPPRPALTLCGADEPRRGCVVVADGPLEAATLRSALAAGARDAVGWPDDRLRLVEVVGRPEAGPVSAGPPLLRVAGAGGGVGTSTIALALAGLGAWSGRDVVVIGDDDLLSLCGIGAWEGPGLAELVALASVDSAAELEALALPVAGVDGLRALGGRSTSREADRSGWRVDLVVVDQGRVGAADEANPPDIVVTAPDARARGAAGIDGPLLVVGDGPLDRAGVRRAAGRSPDGWLEWSARVARAGVAGRVPASLPGSWVDTLRCAVSGALRS